MRQCLPPVRAALASVAPPPAAAASKFCPAFALRKYRSRPGAPGSRVHSLTLDQELHDPVYVPRSVEDGPWRKQDDLLVQAAIEDVASASPRATFEHPPHANVSGSPAAAGAHGAVLLGQDAAQLGELVQQFGQPAYRGKQILDKLLQGTRRVEDLDQLPKSMRADMVAAGVSTGRSVLASSVTAADGTTKFLCQLGDGRVVEAVGIPQDDANRPRLTACISSQVGCPMRCTFCATGKGGFARNLRTHEIVDQVLTIQEHFGKRVSNVVFMGMGEPLLNMRAVVAAVGVINKHIGIGARSITISTVGLPKAIPKLAEYKLQCTLAVSIHAPNQELRESLVPSAKRYSIEQLLADCGHYFRATSRRVTFEYTLMHGVNDSTENANELAAVLKRHRMATHVNLIPWNAVDESEFERPSRNAVSRFRLALEKAGISATVRFTRGTDAAAACGQLRNAHQKTALAEFAQLG